MSNMLPPIRTLIILSDTTTPKVRHGIIPEAQLTHHGLQTPRRTPGLVQLLQTHRQLRLELPVDGASHGEVTNSNAGSGFAVSIVDCQVLVDTAVAVVVKVQQV